MLPKSCPYNQHYPPNLKYFNHATLFKTKEVLKALKLWFDRILVRTDGLTAIIGETCHIKAIPIRACQCTLSNTLQTFLFATLIALELNNSFK